MDLLTINPSIKKNVLFDVPYNHLDISVSHHVSLNGNETICSQSSALKYISLQKCHNVCIHTHTAKFMGPTWAHLGPVGPRWAPPCWPHEPCYQGIYITVDQLHCCRCSGDTAHGIDYVGQLLCRVWVRTSRTYAIPVSRNNWKCPCVSWLQSDF